MDNTAGRWDKCLGGYLDGILGTLLSNSLKLDIGTERETGLRVKWRCTTILVQCQKKRGATELHVVAGTGHIAVAVVDLLTVGHVIIAP